MSHAYTAHVVWSADAEAHRSGQYSRAHEWRFDGGASVRASSAPPVPGSDPSGVDPEEALVAAVSSCHMLFFLAHARRHGLVVTAYDDQAEGRMSPNAEGKLYISRVTLRPLVTFDGPADPAVVTQVHDLAHSDCYLSHSIRGDVVVTPR
ncbi:MAG: OsmC family protein [Brevundimonas sp.]|jgi:organic hydroperoxide reductase OsmC/OhrA|uniref:OsmC family protein n=1 Tax=Brevundimonas sp. TaxID=1871086 RepID=UPI00391C7B34